MRRRSTKGGKTKARKNLGDFGEWCGGRHASKDATGAFLRAVHLKWVDARTDTVSVALE
jgi:hypothetical protein